MSVQTATPAGTAVAATPAPPAPRRRAPGRTRAAGWLFLAPSIALLLLFVGYPIARSAWMSLHDWSYLNPEHRWVGLGNYRELLADDRFWNALGNTLLYSGVVVPVQIVLSLALALGLRRDLRANKLLRSAYFFPVISSLATMAIVWRFLLDPDIGLLNTWVQRLGVPEVNPLQSTALALPTVMAVGLWKNVGFTMVILLAALQDVPEEQYEAAALDGAGPWARLRDVTLPAVRQPLLFATVISVIASLQVFDQVYVLTDGGPLGRTETLVTYMYTAGFEQFRSGYASAIAWVLFVLILAVSVLQLRLFRYREVD